MKILHIAESAKGGVGTYLAELLPHQVRAFGANHVTMLLPHAHAQHVSGADRRSVKTWRRSGRSLASLIRLTLAIRAEVVRFQPTIVHAHSSFAGALVRLLYGWRPVPFQIVYCPHGWGFDRASAQWKLRIAAMLERTLARWCDRVVVISEHERAAGLRIGIPDDKLTRILNGIGDIAPVRPARWDDDRLKVLFVGRLDEQKGFDTLLDAVEPFKDRICVRAVGKAIAGPVGTHRRIEQVTYLGWRSLSEVATEIAAADVVAVPSRWEGFGLVALEAMRARRAVVASDVGGLREIVVAGVTGLLTPVDQPELLGRTLLSLPRARWHEMGHAGRARYEQHFTAERMHREMAELYTQLTQDVRITEPIGQAAHA